MELWVPKKLGLSQTKAAQAFEQQHLPLALAKKELDGVGVLSPSYQPRLNCDSFLEALAAMEQEEVATILPGFLGRAKASKTSIRIKISKLDAFTFQFYLAWNPRLMRLNSHAIRKRDWLADALCQRFAESG